MTTLCAAFQAGRESPYELKGQEIRRVLKEMTGNSRKPLSVAKGLDSVESILHTWKP